MQFKVSVELSYIRIYNIRDISKSFKSLQLADYYLFKEHLVWFLGAMVRTRDSEYSDPRSNLGRPQIYINL